MIDNTYPGKRIARVDGATATFYEESERVILVVDRNERQNYAFAAAHEALSDLEQELRRK